MTMMVLLDLQVAILRRVRRYWNMIHFGMLVLHLIVAFTFFPLLLATIPIHIGLSKVM